MQICRKLVNSESEEVKHVTALIQSQLRKQEYREAGWEDLLWSKKHAI
jgi:hypothetical protein